MAPSEPVHVRCSSATSSGSSSSSGSRCSFSPVHLVFIPHATAGVNVAARALALEAGDGVVSTDLECGALDPMWELLCGERGALYVRAPVRLPVESAEEIVETIWAEVQPAYARALPQPSHVADGIDVAGGGALETRPRTRDPDDRRRSTRSWTLAARPRHPRPRLLRGELPQVVVPFAAKKTLGDNCSDGSPNEARRHSVGPSPASLHASARLRISVRLRGDAPPRKHPRREDSCGEARIWVRNCARGLAHRVEAYPAERSFFAPEEEPASGPGSDASRAEIGRDEVDAATQREGRGKGPSSLHGAC